MATLVEDSQVFTDKDNFSGRLLPKGIAYEKPTEDRVLLNHLESESDSNKRKRYALRYSYLVLSICFSFIFAAILFVLGFVSTAIDEEPLLVDKKTSIQSTHVDQPKKEPEKPIEAKLNEQTDMPKQPDTPQMKAIKAPPIKLDYSVNTNLSVGIAVPAPPSMSQVEVSNTPFSASQLDEQPNILYSPRPNYPSAAIKAKVEATVIARVIISPDGKVVSVEILPGEHSELFAAEAIKSLERWRFKPGKLAGNNVSTVVEIPLAFSLED